jgi:hypothetical protein
MPAHSLLPLPHEPETRSPASSLRVRPAERAGDWWRANGPAPHVLRPPRSGNGSSASDDVVSAATPTTGG